MEKAYSSYAKNKYYAEFSFLSKITNFRKCSNQEHGTGLSYQQIEKLNFWRCNKKFREYNDMMRC
jgi:L,D-peptidoglycan transpeptidase YkuD (ErfK/YbiS/YcfS/YnhG family)